MESCRSNLGVKHLQYLPSKAIRSNSATKPAAANRLVKCIMTSYLDDLVDSEHRREAFRALVSASFEVWSSGVISRQQDEVVGSPRPKERQARRVVPVPFRPLLLWPNDLRRRRHRDRTRRRCRRLGP